MTTPGTQRPELPIPAGADRPIRPGSDRWFTPEQEAENCTRLLGHRRHGLDPLPTTAPGSSSAPR